MDSEGDLVAIGADLNSGSNGAYAGHVRIFNASGCFTNTNFTIKNAVPWGNLESPATATICENGDFDAYGLINLPGANGGSSCNNFDNFDKFCTGSAITFPAGVDQPTAH